MYFIEIAARGSTTVESAPIREGQVHIVAPSSSITKQYYLSIY